MAIQLQKHIWGTIINPQISDKALQAKISDLGYKGSLTQDEALSLYGTVHDKVMGDICTFMRSETASGIYPQVKVLDPKASFSTPLGNALEEKIQALYPVILFPPHSATSTPSLSSRFWALFGY